MVGLVASLLFCSSCSNTPYPGQTDGDDIIYYTSFSSPPKELDPQLLYSQADGIFASLAYESLFSYHYLIRPLQLVPELATNIPEPTITQTPDGKVSEVRYSFEIQPGVLFADDPCFPGGKGRELTAKDFDFVFKRIADPKTNCPVADSFKHILGLGAYAEKLAAMRKETGEKKVPTAEVDTVKEIAQKCRTFAELCDTLDDQQRALLYEDFISPVDLYAKAGDIEGIQVTGKYTFDLVMDHTYPQILYWLAMPFGSAVAQEAILFYYKGRKTTAEAVGPQEFKQRVVGTGPYRFVWEEFDRESRIVAEKNPTWWGSMYPERKAAVAHFPEEPGEASDEALGIWKKEWAGMPVPQISRVEFYAENEALPRFAKFVQGYYDRSLVPEENFDQVIQSGDELTPEMEDIGIDLSKDAEIHISYLAFNMQDDQVGDPVKFKDPALEAEREKTRERNRKLRQALSLAVDSQEFLRIFYNNLGIPAQSVIPPGISGYDPDYQNPYRAWDPDMKRAKELLAEAGYKNGIDPQTGEALKLSFDVGSASSRARVIWNFFIDNWKKLGVNVEMAATDYNKFQKKMEEGSFQIFYWGWLADYPDPENFLFLLYGPNSGRFGAHRPNHAWYENAEYDALFKRMETIKDEESATWQEDGKTITKSRGEIINEMKAILEDDCPWIPIYHQEDFLLAHRWMQRVKSHPITGSNFRYYFIDKPDRDQARILWNKPVIWPAFILLGLLLAIFVPATITVRKERR